MPLPHFLCCNDYLLRLSASDEVGVHIGNHIPQDDEGLADIECLIGDIQLIQPGGSAPEVHTVDSSERIHCRINQVAAIDNTEACRKVH